MTVRGTWATLPPHGVSRQSPTRSALHDRDEAVSALILVVEDEEASAGVLKEILEAENYQVVIAPTAFRARGALNKIAPDLIILDRQLPDADGLDLCKELRAKEQWRSVPILFLSAKKTVRDKVSGLQLGGDDYLAKPFDNNELLARVASLLRQRGAFCRSRPPRQ